MRASPSCRTTPAAAPFRSACSRSRWSSSSSPRGSHLADGAQDSCRVKRWTDNIGTVFVILLIAATIALLVVPVLMTLVASFDARNFMGPFPPKELSLRWYAKLFDNRRYLIGATTTLLVTFPAALIATVVGVSTAMALYRGRFPGKEAIAGLFLSPV